MKKTRIYKSYNRELEPELEPKNKKRARGRPKKNESSKKSEIITIDKNFTSNESLEIKNSLDFAS